MVLISGTWSLGRERGGSGGVAVGAVGAGREGSASSSLEHFRSVARPAFGAAACVAGGGSACRRPLPPHTRGQGTATVAWRAGPPASGRPPRRPAGPNPPSSETHGGWKTHSHGPSAFLSPIDPGWATRRRLACRRRLRRFQRPPLGREPHTCHAAHLPRTLSAGTVQEDDAAWWCVSVRLEWIAGGKGLAVRGGPLPSVRLSDALTLKIPLQHFS